MDIQAQISVVYSPSCVENRLMGGIEVGGGHLDVEEEGLCVSEPLCSSVVLCPLLAL